jgi:transcriptional regulator with XRE-family HTH domain
VDRIKRARKAKGMSLSDVAEKTGLHRVAIARAERAGQDVRASTVAAIAKALGVPVCELFEESGHERERRKRQARK